MFVSRIVTFNKRKTKNVSFLRFVGFSKNLSKLFSGTALNDISHVEFYQCIVLCINLLKSKR